MSVDICFTITDSDLRDLYGLYHQRQTTLVVINYESYYLSERERDVLS